MPPWHCKYCPDAAAGGPGRWQVLCTVQLLHVASRQGGVWYACVQAQKSQGDGRGLRADLVLHAAAPGMPAATLPLTLTPGAPKVLQLLPGHPWEGEVSLDSKGHRLALVGGHQQLFHSESTDLQMQAAARG